MQGTIVRIDDDSAEQRRQLAEQAGDILRRGGLVVFPTETVYGVAASAASAEGVSRLRQLKRREDVQPFSLHLPDVDAIARYVEINDATVQRLIGKSMPGPMTLIVEVTDETIASKSKALGFGPDETARLYHDKTVGLRCPDHPMSTLVLGSIDQPVVASSANRRGEKPPIEVEAAAQSIGDEVDLIVDGGPCRYAKASTIVRILQNHAAGQPAWRIEREGVYDARMIQKMTQLRLLFVCTGNTCRSPMAEAIAKDILAKKRGVDVVKLADSGVHVRSAGAFAGPGLPAAAEAVNTVRAMGVDLSDHRTRGLTEEMVNEADRIFCMTEGHRTAILSMMPGAAAKTVTLDPNGDIDDPIGGPPAVYQQCAAEIRKHIEARLAEENF